MSPKTKGSGEVEVSDAQFAHSNNEKSTATGRGKKNVFYIVGMGGSAGSLEAFEEFFKSMPDRSGLAFVLISHLDPTHKGVMPELIQRTTPMKVVQAKDGMKVHPNRVYVIPPNKDMAILHGTLQLLEPAMPRGLLCLLTSFSGIWLKTRRRKVSALSSQEWGQTAPWV